eukprot:CAMPEP_0184518104 /NCGR_PEP_ID=MMETSP0198_2-20121128/5912_1 /TAXON_ID=1112570 /ORGANISM="Thraustochytrium sp., Strain LLF1b" /LENGTH=86 /DNA_ID=CAMNT_0026908525 /DNA_START=726 /DNA_END=983 /DNA_ORIENTATION=-
MQLSGFAPGVKQSSRSRVARSLLRTPPPGHIPPVQGAAARRQPLRRVLLALPLERPNPRAAVALRQGGEPAPREIPGKRRLRLTWR